MNYEKRICAEAARDLYKALMIIDAIDCNMGLIKTPHYAVIQGCRDSLHAIAEDLYQIGKEE